MALLPAKSYPSYSTTLIDLSTPSGVIQQATLDGIALIDAISDSDGWKYFTVQITLAHHGISVDLSAPRQVSCNVYLSAIGQVTEDDSGWAVDQAIYEKTNNTIRALIAVKGGNTDTGLFRVGYSATIFGKITGTPQSAPTHIPA